MSPTKNTKSSALIIKISKRDGSVANFDLGKITTAVFKAMNASAEGGEKEAGRVAKLVQKELEFIAKKQNKQADFMPNVEEIQDLTEKHLILSQYPATAKAYILYRERRAEARREHGEVSEQVKELVDASKKYFKNSLGEFVFYR
ncbi:MAG: ATP cone domain-containing protein, partial [Candidatus Paceibacterota bacterium]